MIFLVFRGTATHSLRMLPDAHTNSGRFLFYGLLPVHQIVKALFHIICTALQILNFQHIFPLVLHTEQSSINGSAATEAWHYILLKHFFPSPSASVLYARGICVVLLPLLLVFAVSTLLTFHLCNNKQGKLLHQVTVNEAPWIMCWQIVDKDTTPPPARAAHSSACHSQSSVRLLTTKIVSHFFWCRYKRQSKKDTRLPCFMLRTSTASSAFLYIVSCSTWGNKEQKQQQQVRKKCRCWCRCRCYRVAGSSVWVVQE